jgi:hypothetical protein
MSRALVVLAYPSDRDKAIRWIKAAPVNSRVEFKAPRRSLPQNDKLWAMLTEIAEQMAWHGVKLTAEDWKFVFLDSLKREHRLVPNIDGNGFVNLSGRSSSDLSKEEMSNLIELMLMFGAEHGVQFSDAITAEQQAAGAAQTGPGPDTPADPENAAQEADFEAVDQSDDDFPGDRATSSQVDQGGGSEGASPGPNKPPADGQTRAAPLSERVNAVKAAMAKVADQMSLDAIWDRCAGLRRELEAKDPEGLLVDLQDARDAMASALEAVQ